MLSNCSLKLFSRAIIASIFLISLSAAPSFSQGSYTAQLRGTVMDQSKGQVPKATVTITNVSTNIPISTTTDDNGQYVFNGLRPAVYSVKVEAAGFESIVQNNVVLAVSQQSTLDFSLKLGSVSTNVEVKDTAPLLDTGGAALGTDVTNEFINRMPLNNRDITGLVYLSAGITQLNNTDSGYPFGTNFSSNGQRYSTAEYRLDGVLATGPEQGEGATTNLSYSPSSEIVQEFKVQNNSFSAEYGSNGGTVINVVLKSGTNKYHGSGWWFLQRPQLDANDFISNSTGTPKSDYAWDQYGFSLSGPIKKEKTFFLVDLVFLRNTSPNPINVRVPTDLERNGDFSQTLVLDAGNNLVPVSLFNPFQIVGGKRAPVPNGDVKATGKMDLVGQELLKAFPEPTGPVDPNTGFNYNKTLLSTNPERQYDIKIDHQLTAKTRLSGRYSTNHVRNDGPGVFFDGSHGFTDTRNIGLEHAWTLSSHLLWTNRFGLDRIHQATTSDHVDPTQFGLPALLSKANGIVRMSSVLVDGGPGNSIFASLNPQCCVDTTLGHTQYNFSSGLNWITGKHSFKFGGEQRLFYNGFYQPDSATGLFNFTRGSTEDDPSGGSATSRPDFGFGFASLAFGFIDSGSRLNITPSPANKSKETSFYVQDDWKLTSRLTINLGLRYEWSTPYNERFNRLQFSDFKGDSGITVDLTIPSGLMDPNGNPVPDLSSLGLGPTRLKGITHFPTPGRRNVPVDRNNIGPRFGFAYQLMPSTVVRGGAGVFYGLSVATNFQNTGTAFLKEAAIHGSNDGGFTQFATLANPFPNLPAGQVPQAQGTKYGPLANWGFDDGNDLGTEQARNAEVYQWNLGLQHLFPMGIVISADYSASRATHLPWAGTRNRNVMSTAARTLCNSVCQSTQAPNPFQFLFTQVPGMPAPIFNEPDSTYNLPVISLGTLLHPYPQFGGFNGLPQLAASSRYNALLVRFQKRPSHGLSFEGNYTLAKSTDNSSFGANNFIFFGGNGLAFPQDPNNLRAEQSVSANDNRHRFVIATVYDLPLGRGRWVGHDMNRVLSAVVGGWSVNSLITLQTGQPIPFAMDTGLLADGMQRPNITCSNPRSGLSLHQVISTPGANYFNLACFSDPGDQVPGNAPRFSSNARGPYLHNTDLGIFKEFKVREGMKLEMRGEFFNFTNTPRFRVPNSSFGNGDFGHVNQLARGSGPRHAQLGVRFEF